MRRARRAYGSNPRTASNSVIFCNCMAHHHVAMAVFSACPRYSKCSLLVEGLLYACSVVVFEASTIYLVIGGIYSKLEQSSTSSYLNSPEPCVCAFEEVLGLT
jgi:hypothetical protein